MDWIQFPFEVDARVHDGPGAPLLRLRWVYTDQPFLPLGTSSVINNRIWNEDQDSFLAVGQQPNVLANYRQDERWVFPALLLNGHMCHPEWFHSGEPWPNSLPPTAYAPGWVPECCLEEAMCEFELCTDLPVNAEPASQHTQYPIPANESTPATPFRRVQVAQAQGGALLPGWLAEFFGAGSAGTAGYSREHIENAAGAVQSDTEIFDFGGGASTQFQVTPGVVGVVVNDGASAGTVSLSFVGGVLELCGVNAQICAAMLPAIVQQQGWSQKNAAGTTQADATILDTSDTYTIGPTQTNNAGFTPPPHTFGTWPFASLTNVATAGTVRFYAGAGAKWWNPTAGGQLVDYVEVPPGFTLIGREVSTGRWSVLALYQAGVAPPTGTVTSVGIGTTSTGVTVGGGPITGAGTLTVDLDADLQGLVGFTANTSLLGADGAGNWVAVALGSWVTYDGATLDVTFPSETHGQKVCAAFTITAASGAWQATGQTFDLPAAGTYLVTGRIRATVQCGAAGYHYISAKLRNNDLGADVANSETAIAMVTINGDADSATASFSAIITVGTVTELELYAQRGGTTFAISDIASDNLGRTVFDWVRLI